MGSIRIKLLDGIPASQRSEYEEMRERVEDSEELQSYMRQRPRNLRVSVRGMTAAETASYKAKYGGLVPNGMYSRGVIKFSTGTIPGKSLIDVFAHELTHAIYPRATVPGLGGGLGHLVPTKRYNGYTFFHLHEAVARSLGLSLKADDLADLKTAKADTGVPSLEGLYSGEIAPVKAGVKVYDMPEDEEEEAEGEMHEH